MLLNEMIKCSSSLLLPSVTKLFNLILNSGIFPDAWNVAYQVPLFKGGDVQDPNDYRGISITSCLGKIFNKALNSRLRNKIELDNQMGETQAAHRQDYSTVDQLFILKSLLNKYTSKRGGKLYGCFVDFKKAFDSVWHAGLLYKLVKLYHVGGNFYQIIKNMYSRAKSCVKTQVG